jgi:UDPglucose--hexose-1-phosphate uridylyltransferase
LGDLRKDYVLDKFVVMHEGSQAASEDRHSNGGGKCPYCPGNELMTEPATLALVVKEGMLQRLSDSEDSIIDDWSVRVFQSEKPVVVTGCATSYSDKPLIPSDSGCIARTQSEPFAHFCRAVGQCPCGHPRPRKVALHPKRCDVCLNLCEQRCQRRCAGNPSSPKHRYFFFYTSSYRHGGRRLTQVHE